MISIKHIFKEMLAEKTRLFLTILAIAWGTLSVALMLSVGEGLRVTFGNATNGVGQNVIFAQGGQTTTNYGGYPENLAVSLLQQDFHSIVKGVPEIQSASRIFSFSATIQYQLNTYPAQISAVDPSFGPMRNITPQAGGRFIDYLDMQNARRVIVLGNDLAQTLFPEINPINKTVLISNQPFLVIGVMRKKFEIAGPPDDYSAWIPSATYIALNEPTSINRLVLTPKTSAVANNLESDTTKLVANNHGFDPNDPNIMQYHNFQDMQTTTAAVFSGMEIFLGIIGTLTLIVAGVGIANVMFISVNQATKEIGIRMALGARTYQILSHYVIEGLITTSIGGVLGIALTEFIISLIAKIPAKGAFFQQIGKPVPILSPAIFIIVIFILGITGFLAGLFPARKAASVDPAIALRHD